MPVDAVQTSLYRTSCPTGERTPHCPEEADCTSWTAAGWTFQVIVAVVPLDCRGWEPGKQELGTMNDYPRWIYYPRSEKAPSWVRGIVSVFHGQRAQLDTATVHNKSDVALSIIRPGLEELGFRVEGGAQEPTIYRPVHFGEGGAPDRQYQIDSYHSELRVGLEVEAGRSIRGNAIYRDIIQASLIVDLDYFVLAIP